jgi:hypothetical protein
MLVQTRSHRRRLIQRKPPEEGHSRGPGFRAGGSRCPASGTRRFRPGCASVDAGRHVGHMGVRTHRKAPAPQPQIIIVVPPQPSYRRDLGDAEFLRNYVPPQPAYTAPQPAYVSPPPSQRIWWCRGPRQGRAFAQPSASRACASSRTCSVATCMNGAD